MNGAPKKGAKIVLTTNVFPGGAERSSVTVDGGEIWMGGGLSDAVRIFERMVSHARRSRPRRRERRTR